MYFNITLHSTPKYIKWFLLFRLSYKNVVYIFHNYMPCNSHEVNFSYCVLTVKRVRYKIHYLKTGLLIFVQECTCRKNHKSVVEILVLLFSLPETFFLCM